MISGQADGGTQQLPPARQGSLAQDIGAQFAELGLDVARPAQPPQHGAGFRHASMAGQPARRFRQCQHPDGEDHPRHRAQRQHPAPFAVPGEEIADEIGDQDADGDGELVEGDQGAAAAGRRRLGQIERRQHGGDTDAHAHQQSPDKQCRHLRRQSGDERAGDEDEPGEEDDHAPAEPVGKTAREGSTHGRTGKRDARDQPLHAGGESEVRPDEEECSGNHAGVVAEKQPAQRRDADDQIEIHFRL